MDFDAELRKTLEAAAQLRKMLDAAVAGRDVGAVPISKGISNPDDDNPMRATLAQIAEEDPDEAARLAVAAGVDLPGAGGIELLRARVLAGNRARGLSESEALVQSAADFPRLWRDPAFGVMEARPPAGAARVTKAGEISVAVLAHRELEKMASADLMTDPEALYETRYEKRASGTEAGRACVALISRGRGISLEDARADADLAALLKRAGL